MHTSDHEMRTHSVDSPPVNHRAELVYQHSSGELVRKNVLRTTTLIGSAKTSNLQLISSQIEPAHCVITLDGRGLRLWDLRTKEGTFVNEQKVKSARLQDGDQVRIGRFRFRLETNLADQSRQGFFIDEYRVVGILGTGGMGWLYVVEDPRTLQRYALKVLMKRSDSPTVQQDELKTRFQLEGEFADRLKHPNIVDVVEYQHRDDVEYLLLELFESINLQELIKRDSALHPLLVCTVGKQAAEALHHIHQVGSIHRDVKPANILVGHDGTTKICDFGLVFIGKHPVEDQLAEQMGNDCLGTADYISPEQSRNSYRIDGRADIYSLGCTLYQALTSQVPFQADTSKGKILAHRDQPFTPIRELNRDVPPKIAAIVEKCMAKDPASRYQTGHELSEALGQFADPVTVEFDFQQLLAKRTKNASFRLSDPRKRHYLNRIPANVASALQSTSSEMHMESGRTVLDTQIPQQSGIATNIVTDTDAARELL